MIKSGMDVYSGVVNGSQQHGERHNHDQSPGIQHNHQDIQQDSSVDSPGYGHNVGQKQFCDQQVPQLQSQHSHGLLSSQHQNQQPDYNQGHNVDLTDYKYNSEQQQLYNSQVPPPRQGQQPDYHNQDIAHHRSQSNSQPPYLQLDPVAQMVHIPRAGIGDDLLCYNLVTDMPYNYNGNKRHHNPHRQIQHQYESIPGLPDQLDPYSQQQQQQNPSRNQINPYNLEEGSMMLYGDPPQSGVIKWIGYLPEAANVLTAGVEMVNFAQNIIRIINIFNCVDI